MSEISAKITLDSITDGGSRLVTWELTYPRSIHAELMTYRVLSRNLASSRAISLKKMRKRVAEGPFVPITWGADQKGMQAHEQVDDVAAAERWWSRCWAQAIDNHATGEALGLHKQIVNRVLEPYAYAIGVVTMTDHANLFHQRRHHAAEPHFQRLANLMWEAFHEHTPTYREPGEWHLPYVVDPDTNCVSDEDYDFAAEHMKFDGVGRRLVWTAGRHAVFNATTNRLTEGGVTVAVPGFKRSMSINDGAMAVLRKLSTARCARVSYLNHDGKRDPVADVALHDKLIAGAATGDPLHASPFEHQAEAVGGRERIKNFEGWRMYRCYLENEAGPSTEDRCDRCGCWGGRHVTHCTEAA